MYLHRLDTVLTEQKITPSNSCFFALLCFPTIFYFYFHMWAVFFLPSKQSCSILLMWEAFWKYFFSNPIFTACGVYLLSWFEAQSFCTNVFCILLPPRAAGRGVIWYFYSHLLLLQWWIHSSLNKLSFDGWIITFFFHSHQL